MLLHVAGRRPPGRPGGGGLFGVGDGRLWILLAVLVLILVIAWLDRRHR